MSKALYRKYRSKSLDEIVGQNHITDILSRAISSGNISHAYLLTGPRGVGKTSVARIMAYAINNLPYNEEETCLDIIEIDAASNNGVEDIRDLREKVQIAPVVAKKKIYIIDEVHMLSKSAFNALLKTLEEPPEHVVFILATTNVEKIPATIVSRVQRFSFRPIHVDDAVKHLSNIAKNEKINITDDALRMIAERGDGSFRDSISLLDQLSNLIDQNSNDKITPELIENLLGLTSDDIIKDILSAIENHDLPTTVKILDKAYDDGVNCVDFANQLALKIRKDIISKPQFLSLLDSLIEVQKSPQPQLKLLSVIGMATADKQTTKSAPLLASVHEVSATVAELEKKALRNKPKEPKQKIVKKEEDKTQTTKSISKTAVKDFDWNELIEQTHKNYISLYVVLSKCGHSFDGKQLTIYTNNKFYKNKLDDKKYSCLLSKCLQEIGIYNMDIHTIPTVTPPTDSQAAKIAAIMGGGEEVSLGSI